ncbi:hypothetical protein [Microvirga solisilvae]|uniref:hypothetical protein n=1 Tax=Microvirga solisilvae TaxID=2919498 RepID=UPI001FAFB8D9|nr:hypothetical protein [Microvirga solisilvae]
MLANPLVSGAFPSALPDSGRDSDPPPLRAMGERSPFGEEAETRPTPAATDRAETVFETTGIVLILLIALAAAWILIRQRL